MEIRCNYYVCLCLPEWYGESAVPPKMPLQKSVGNCRRYSALAVPSKQNCQSGTIKLASADIEKKEYPKKGKKRRKEERIEE